MNATKEIIVAVLCVIAFNLFYYARYQRVMAEAKRRLAEEKEAEQAPDDGDGDGETGDV